MTFWRGYARLVLAPLIFSGVFIFHIFFHLSERYIEICRFFAILLPRNLAEIGPYPKKSINLKDESVFCDKPNMFTLTSLAVLSGLLSGMTVSTNDIILNKNIDNNDGNEAIVRSVDGWSENSIKNISGQSIDNDQKLMSNVSKKIAHGSKVDYSVVDMGEVLVSAFSSTPDQTDDTPFIMASGNHVYYGAVATNFLPLGTKVRFPDQYGDKIFVVEDRMNKRYHYKMDIWMESREKALDFGLRKLKYEVVKETKEALAER